MSNLIQFFKKKRVEGNEERGGGGGVKKRSCYVNRTLVDTIFNFETVPNYFFF